jgi:pyruvate,orthophosphate dikinase
MRVFTFGNGTAEGLGDMVDLLGGKGAGLAAMSRLGVPVPPGFTLSTAVCRVFYSKGGRTLPDEVRAEVDRGIAHIEALTGRRLGDPSAPLLVSVRSGAAVSMPGMMDTVLDVGLTRASLDGLAARGTGRRFALDSYRRLMEMYAEIVLGLEPSTLISVRDAVLEEAGAASIARLSEPFLEGLIAVYENALAAAGEAVPADPRAQVDGAILGVLRSWNTRRAVNHRRTHGIPDDLGTAVTVQAMVFGNLGPTSATGVAFTRHPTTGERRLSGEYLPDAQGEDVVGGAHEVWPLTEADGLDPPGRSLEALHPPVYAELCRIAGVLEARFRDVQDLEFTIEDGRVWMLQTRAATRSVRAAVRVAVEMVREGLLTEDEALARVEPESLTRLMHPSVDAHARPRILARGLPASPGAVSGVVVFNPDEAVARSAAGERVILVRVETSTEDMEAIRASEGVLTSRGGLTSHAALVARGLGRCCVTGCADIVVDERRGQFRIRTGNQIISAGMTITLDGSTGEVMLGEVATTPADPPESFAVLMGWADARRRLEVRANADAAAAARKAADHGADGVGLCCTEHMFLEDDRLDLVRSLVLAPDAKARRTAVERILPSQRHDFRALLGAMPDKPVAIRLLDLPLHDFMPSEVAELREVAARLDTPLDQIITRAQRLRATNPLLGHRGCRVGLTFPELYEVQVRALFEAVVDLGTGQAPQVIIPFVTCAEELIRLRRRIEHMAQRVAGERGVERIDFTLGPMVESPRACLSAAELAVESDFFLFGTNDLTVMTFGLNRDDSGRFLPFYLENDVLPADPFVRLDQGTVGKLVEFAVTHGRRARPGLPCGLAGNHAGEPDAVEWAHRIGLDYVTCAPHRVPIARLAAARATLGRGVSA